LPWCIFRNIDDVFSQQVNVLIAIRGETAQSFIRVLTRLM
jgi:hypothetical protein